MASFYILDSELISDYLYVDKVVSSTTGKAQVTIMLVASQLGLRGFLWALPTVIDVGSKILCQHSNKDISVK